MNPVITYLVYNSSIPQRQCHATLVIWQKHFLANSFSLQSCHCYAKLKVKQVLVGKSALIRLLNTLQVILDWPAQHSNADETFLTPEMEPWSGRGSIFVMYIHILVVEPPMASRSYGKSMGRLSNSLHNHTKVSETNAKSMHGLDLDSGLTWWFWWGRRWLYSAEPQTLYKMYEK